MAQWQDLGRLDSALQSQVTRLYERRFPREIRQYLSDWIENQDWDSAAVDENRAKTCFKALLQYLEEQQNRSIQENNVLQAPDFSKMKADLVRHFHKEPLKMAKLLSECLKEERKILASASGTLGFSNPGMDQKWRELDNKVTDLKRQISEVNNEMKKLEGLNEKLDFLQKGWQSRVEEHVELAQTQAVMEEKCIKWANLITWQKQVVLQLFCNILSQANQTVATLTDVELPQWKLRQQMACIGGPVDTCLDHLQTWFTAVAEVLFGVREQLQRLQDQNKKYSSTFISNLSTPEVEIEKFARSLLTKLLTNALVVEKQPVTMKAPQRPLILKTGGVRFKVTVRFLANLPEFKCLLKVTPVFDKDVEEVRTINGFRQFEFSSGDGKVMGVDTLDGGLRAEFGHMALKEKITRSNGSCETDSQSRLGVTEELHIIRFVTVFHHAGLECNIEASSLPVVVITSSSQASASWASIIWWLTLSTSEPRSLSLFTDPPPLTWQQLSQMLSWQFLSVGQRGLDENQLTALRDKLVDDPDGLVHWGRFSKIEWVWIDGILDLIKKYLVDFWREGYIMGFVSRDRTRLLLKTKQTGTFVLRFSESNKEGAITFSWVDHSNGETYVHAVEPYTKKELQSITLPDIVYHYSLTTQTNSRNPLVYLYPDIHKDTAFGRYYKPSEISTPTDVDGYVNRKPASISVNPSPPREPHMMDLDLDMGTMTETDQLLDDLLSDVLDSPASDVFWTSYQEPHPLSPQFSFTDNIDLLSNGFSNVLEY